MSRLVIVLAAMLVSEGAAALTSDGNAATLYRSSVALENARLHIATFDAADGFDYNWGNCQIAAELFQQQPGVKVRYWCEKGRYHK
jgi:hypothetical protein